MGRNERAGIEAIAVHVPNLYLDLKDLAQANSVDPAKYQKGLGCQRMAWPEPDEDPVSMAAEVAHRLIDSYAVDPATIGMVIAGTESGVDAAKPIASFVHGLLSLPQRCRTFDTQHACYGATAGLRLALDWCRTTRKRALVIATDIARYDVHSPGEPTQGAGAVAMLVGPDPAVVQFEDPVEAVYASHVFDFFRPHYRSTAVVDGRYSLECYLTALENTYVAYTEATGRRLLDFRYLLFHVPFPKMAWKAFGRVYDIEQARNHTELPSKEELFARMTEPALWGNREVGNVYSGSLYLSLASLLEADDAAVEGAFVGMFSYGSGNCAEFLAGRVCHDASVWRNRTGLRQLLAERRRLTHAEYLALREPANPAPFTPSPRRYRFLGIENHQRKYVGPKASHSRNRAGDAYAGL